MQGNKINYIIVGQGLAGTALAFTLLKNGKSVRIIDSQNFSKASRIAAGLYNPVVFKRLVKSWMADELIPFMDAFYAEKEQLLQTTFYFKKQIVKLFADEQEKALWLKKSQDDVGKYLSADIGTPFFPNSINNPFGSASVIHAGNLDTSHFLKSSRNYFIKTEMLLDEAFDYKQLTINEHNVCYNNLSADKIIFCEGYRTTDNPYFSWLPFKLTKGETLTISLRQAQGTPQNEERLNEIPFEKVVNKGVFILPVGDNIYKVGATYEWNDLTENTTEKGKAELVEKLQKVLNVPFNIIDHQAGVRPTVIDRRPILGLHPKHPSIGVFNGLGTKGVMLAPYFAQHFYEFLEQKTLLNKEVDILRFLPN